MTYIIDASCMETKEQTHLYLKEALHLPDYYGKNLDALADCVSEQSDLLIKVVNTDHAGAYYSYVKRVLTDCEVLEEL